VKLDYNSYQLSYDVHSAFASHGHGVPLLRPHPLGAVPALTLALVRAQLVVCHHLICHLLLRYTDAGLLHNVICPTPVSAPASTSTTTSNDDSVSCTLSRSHCASSVPFITASTGTDTLRPLVGSLALNASILCHLIHNLNFMRE
jgi:hypothetical protein